MVMLSAGSGRALSGSARRMQGACWQTAAGPVTLDGLMTTPLSTDWDDPGRLDAEMAAEQAVIDRAYARIEAMREAARSVSADVMESTPGGTHQARLERDVRVRVTERRLASLQVGEAGLVFGRTDAESGERHHIGRVAISDDD
ncbi:MAG: hypothetical protein QOD63_293, partial [Actinomycetota bacterium]|nr:hypothetical protein [Actinomycetota bacterium]